VAAVTAVGGYSVYMRNSATQQVELWSLNASGARTAMSTLTSGQLTREEAALNRDLNGDGNIAVSLTTTPEGYALLTAGQALIPVTYPGGNASPSNPGNNWAATAGAADNSGYTLYWSNSSTQQTARWSLDASGAYTGGSMLSPTELFGEEANLRRDLNNDGFVAGPSTVGGVNLGNVAEVIRRSGVVEVHASLRGVQPTAMHVRPPSTPAAADAAQADVWSERTRSELLASGLMLSRPLHQGRRHMCYDIQTCPYSHRRPHRQANLQLRQFG
jgi:hypothetical protein